MLVWGNPTRRPWPWPGAGIDLDFIRQRYFWGNAVRRTSEFTTYTLNGSTFDNNGLTPSTTIDVTLALTGLGTFVPGSVIMVGRNSAAPGATKEWYVLDNGTTNERSGIIQESAGSWALLINTAASAVANISVGSSLALGLRHGFVGSYDTNDCKAASNYVSGTQDTVAAMPTITTLRIGKNTGASTNPSGAISRLILFTSTKLQGEMLALSQAIRSMAT